MKSIALWGNICKYVYLVLILFSAECLRAQPVITSFSPTTGPVGTIVTIYGTGYDPTPTNNIVYFGAAKATVLTSGTNSLTVQVPGGATYEPLKVTIANLTACSNQPFIVTFNAGGIYPNSFSLNGSLDNLPGSLVSGIAAADFDLDGKNDLAIIDRPNSSLSLYKNTTVSRVVSFAGRINYTTGSNPEAIVAADINGDGLQDLITVNRTSNNISVYRNTSTSGNISFAPKSDFTTGNTPIDIAAADIDGDGKTDIVTSNTQSLGSVSVLRNTSSSGTISFVAKVDSALGNGSGKIKLGDMDGDGKPDVVITSNQLNAIFVMRNTSMTGVISLAARQSFASGGNFTDALAIGDLNADGKPDVVAVNYNSANISVFKNLSTVGNISFAIQQSYSSGDSPGDIEINDLDGDGMPDIAIIKDYESVAVFKNTMVGGNISFNPVMNYLSGILNSKLCIADVDGDGKADISAATGSLRVLFFINKSNEPQITSFTPSNAAAGSTVNITGYNFAGTTNISFGGVDATSFTINSATSISAVVSGGVSGSISITNANGIGTKSGFVFAGPPVISSFTPTSASTGTEVTISGYNFTGVTAVRFGGTAASSFTSVSPFTLKAIVAQGASGTLSVTSNYGIGSITGFTYVPVPAITSFTPVSTGSGNTVTISGKDFLGTTEVSFGGTPASSFTVVSATFITAVVASGASGSVSVTTPFGVATSPGFTFKPAPVITSFTPTAAGPGLTVTITGNNFTGATVVSIGGTPASTFNVVSANTITAVVGTGTSGNISVTTAGGTGTLAGFTHVPTPTLSFFTPITGAGGTVIITGTNLFTATSVSFGGIAASSFTVQSATIIHAVAATGGSGNVSVSTAGGTATLPNFLFTTVPVINSFTPSAGSIGATLTINGANFSSIAANNIVYFGAVRAGILSSTTNTITVIVPTGATSNKITVTSNNLTASSQTPFVVTYTGGGAFTATSFAGKIDFAAGASPVSIASGDLNEDGKPDVIVANKQDNTISIFKNASTNGTLGFAGKIDSFAGTNPHAIRVGDIDGDGKQDVVLLNSGGSENTVTIFRNTSTGGNISFSQRLIFATDFQPSDLAIADLDLDGKQDLAITHFGYSIGGQEIISVLKNTSTSGNISFAQKQQFNAASMVGSSMNYLTTISVADINGDYKPDLIVGSLETALAMLKNQSVGTTVLLNSEKLCSCFSGSVENVSTADLNGDDKPDIITDKAIFNNTSNINSYTFNSQYISTGIGGINAFDALAGGNKLDMVKINPGSANVSVTRNNSSAGSISFGSGINYQTGTDPRGIITADFNGDGKADIATANFGSNTFSVLLNNMTYSGPPAVYNFSGSGNWGDAFNWSNNLIPPSPLPPGSEVIINPSAGNCIMNIPFAISTGGKLTVANGKHLLIQGNLTMQSP